MHCSLRAPGKSSQRNSSSSRRSSILKLPKQRPPLQNINVNNSSNENSPATTKFKRRVSFAEKKHVKEFCSSVEQGTVWDNTYEEHDLSNSKISPTSKQWDAPGVNVTNNANDNESCQSDSAVASAKENIDQENTKVCLLNGMALVESDSMLDFTAPVGGTNLVNVLQGQEEEEEQMEMSYDSPIVFPNNTSHKREYVPIPVYEDDDTDNPMTRTSNRAVATSSEIVCHSHLNQSSEQTKPMEFTEVISTNAGINPETLDASMEITTAVASHMNMYHNSDPPDRILFNSTSKTQHFHDASMELTVGLQSLKNPPFQHEQNIEKQISMEFTTVVPSVIKFIDNNPTRGTNRCFIEDERTKVFHNTSMEMTTAIPSIPSIYGKLQTSDVAAERDTENATVFLGTPMEITAPIDASSVMKNFGRNTSIGSHNTVGKVGMNEKTELLNTSMNITKVVDTHIVPENKNVDLHGFNDATVYCDDVMAFTTVITPKINDNKNDPESLLERTKIFHNASMALTMPMSSFNSEDRHYEKEILNSGRNLVYEDTLIKMAVSSKVCNDENNTESALDKTSFNSEDKYKEKENINSGKNLIYNDMSAEITLSKIGGNKNNPEPILDRTKIFQDSTMAFTMPISSFNSENIRNEKENIVSEKMLLLEDARMEVSASSKTCNSRNDPELILDRTNTLQNNSMALTIPIPSFNSEDMYKGKENTNSRKASISGDALTKATALSKMDSIKSNNARNNSEDLLEKTKIFQNNSMALTMPISVFNAENAYEENENVNQETSPTCRDAFKCNSEDVSGKTRIFQNNSMAFTIPIPSHISESLYKERENTNTENILTSADAWTETTASSKICNFECNSEDASGKTKVFQNNSLAFTMPIPSLLSGKMYMERENANTENILTSADESTKAIPSSIVRSSRNNLEDEIDKTKLFQNNSMTFTMAISSLNSEHMHKEKDNVSSDRISTSGNASMQVASSSRTCNTNTDSEQTFDKRKTIHNNSMAFTMSISSFDLEDKHKEQETSKPNKILVFKDTSMEGTEAVCNVHPATSKNIQHPLSSRNLSKDSDICIEANKENVAVNYTSSACNTPAMIASTIPSLLRIHPMLDKENCPIETILEAFPTDNLRQSVSNEPNCRNNKSSMSLHELVQPDASALALEGNNAPLACAANNPGLDNNFTTISQNNSHCAQLNNTQQKKSVLTLTNNEALPRERFSLETCEVTDNKKNNEITFDNNDFLEENAGVECNTLKGNEDMGNTSNSNVQQFTNESFQLYSESLEELETIKPPSFVCLDDSADEDCASANIPYDKQTEINQDIAKTRELLSADETVKNIAQDFPCNLQDYNVVRDHYVSVVDDDATRKSHTFAIKCKQSEEDRKSLKLDCTNRLEIPEVQKLQVTYLKDTNKEDQTVNCSSITLADICDGTVELQNCSHLENRVQSGLASADDPQCDVSHSSSAADDTSKQVELSIDKSIEPELEEDKCLENQSRDKRELSGDQSKVEEVRMPVRKVTETDHHESSLNMEESRVSEPDVVSDEEDVSMKLEYFSELVNELKTHALSDDVIWEIYHESIENKMVVAGFISCSLLVVIFMTDDCDDESSRGVKEIKIVSRLAEDAGTLISMVHRIVLEKIDIKKLMYLYRSCEDIILMLEDVTAEVKLAMDFMFDLKRLDSLNLMEISSDRVSFISRTKRMDIILRITLNIKPFDKIDSQDISVSCLSGSIREEDVKRLITGIKRDHKFLHRFMNDVRDYIYLMEESSVVLKS